MRLPVLILLATLLSSPVIAQAQSASTAVTNAVQDLPPAPGITVIKNTWRKDVHNPAMDEDPLQASRDAVQLQDQRRDNIKDNQTLAKLGRDPEPPPTKSRSAATRQIPPPASEQYVYEVKLGNTGNKTITALVLEYVFLEPDTGEQVNKHRFSTAAKIRPGKNQTLFGLSNSPPTRTVDARNAGKDWHGLYLEKVVIYRIDYDDGTYWERPANQ